MSETPKPRSTARKPLNLSWDDVLKLGPTVIARVLGCSVTTASSWINRSGPPDWQREIYLDKFRQQSPSQLASLSSARRKPTAPL